MTIHEFRAMGRDMRFTTQREVGSPGEVIPGTRVWHDYDGDEIYADLSFNFYTDYDFTTTEIASHEPGIGSRDWTAAAGSQTTYRHGDQIGTTRAVSDQPTSGDAAVTGRVVYTAFGERVWQDGSIGATRYQYAGAWGYQTFPPYAGTSEDELPFIHVGHRWYDPATGRFLQRDPIGIAGGANVYVYVGNLPTVLVDPLGLAWWNPFDYQIVANAYLWATDAAISATGLNIDDQEVVDTLGIGFMATGCAAGVGAGAGMATGLLCTGGAAAPTVTFGHGARHLIGSGLSQGAVESAISQAVQKGVAGASGTIGWFWGRVVVEGQQITYRGQGIGNGIVKIGTYFITQ